MTAVMAAVHYTTLTKTQEEGKYTNSFLEAGITLLLIQKKTSQRKKTTR